MNMKKSGYIYTHKCNSLHCTSETNKTLQINYTPTKFFLKIHLLVLGHSCSELLIR